MPEHTTITINEAERITTRKTDSEMQGLICLRLLAPPNPKEFSTEVELRNMSRDARHNPELIQHLIDVVKSL
jgi:hypothetical protein